jgi:hypothetical protein
LLDLLEPRLLVCTHDAQVGEQDLVILCARLGIGVKPFGLGIKPLDLYGLFGEVDVDAAEASFSGRLFSSLLAMVS